MCSFHYTFSVWLVSVRDRSAGSSCHSFSLLFHFHIGTHATALVVMFPLCHRPPFQFGEGACKSVTHRERDRGVRKESERDREWEMRRCAESRPPWVVVFWSWYGLGLIVFVRGGVSSLSYITGLVSQWVLATEVSGNMNKDTANNNTKVFHHISILLD
jgi:hypothetical protein